MKDLPQNVVAYKRTPEFDEVTVPSGLLHDHRTRENVWGKIVILEGTLLYTIDEPLEEVLLDTLNSGIVEPAVLHHVTPQGRVRFYVEFYK